MWAINSILQWNNSTAPGDASGNMEKTFNSAMTAIEEIEEVMKRNGGRKR